MKWGDKEHCAAIAAMDQAAGNFHALPSYKVEALAMGRGSDDEQARAIEELGRRYAVGSGRAAWYSGVFLKRLATAYTKGFCGMLWPHVLGRAGNWAKPLVRAYEAGRREHANLNMLMNTRGDES